MDEQDPSTAGEEGEPAVHRPVEAGAAGTGYEVEPAPEQATQPVTAEAASRQAIAYRLLGAACALVGVLLVVGGLVALRGRDTPSPAAAPTSTPAGTSVGVSTGAAATSAPATTVPPQTTTPPPPSSTPPPATTVRPPASTVGKPATSPATARSPLTVLNNTTRTGLADQVATEFRAAGWSVVKVGNFTGKIPSTTVYYDPGNTTEQRAAEALARQFRDIARVLPRYDGLPDSVHGVIVVLAPDWP